MQRQAAFEVDNRPRRNCRYSGTITQTNPFAGRCCGFCPRKNGCITRDKRRGHPSMRWRLADKFNPSWARREVLKSHQGDLHPSMQKNYCLSLAMPAVDKQGYPNHKC
mmetsp:Transcript_101895/g.202308  ORF Transcript_101895/g.202308 Transcript_101895/m.202308 type:complete len:108 (+) Transcript_101895:401-724(+)